MVQGRPVLLLDLQLGLTSLKEYDSTVFLELYTVYTPHISICIGLGETCTWCTSPADIQNNKVCKNAD